MKKHKCSDPHITTLESLFQHLQWAIEVEHFTIPPYLCALYSIPEGGKNQISREVLQSVVMEEMLHMTNAANILNAVGGRPAIDSPKFIPRYPCRMPHSGAKLLVSLQRFSESAVDTFLRIEKPEEIGTPEQEDHYQTIGQLYDAIEEGLICLCQTLGHDNVFTGNIKGQVTDKYYYGGGGKVIVVNNLEKALKAVKEVKEQGEGLVEIGSVWDGDAKNYGQSRELAHFYRFNEIKLGKFYRDGDTAESGPNGPKFKVYWNEVYKMQKNPKAGKYKNQPEIYALMQDFNRIYTALLGTMNDAFNGKPHLLLDAVGKMYELKYKAVELMHISTGKGNTMVGPSFQYLHG